MALVTACCSLFLIPLSPVSQQFLISNKLLVWLFCSEGGNTIVEGFITNLKPQIRYLPSSPLSGLAREALAGVISLASSEIDQNKGISSSTQLLKNSSEEAPVSSPLVPVSLLGSSKGEEQNQKPITKAEKVQAVLKKIKQSPKKLNLVAALVRGMLVKDALLQLQVTVKRASKTVYQVIHSARANASHNHGLDPERLIVAEAFVGKGDFKRRISYHGKGRSGVMHRPEFPTMAKEDLDLVKEDFKRRISYHGKIVKKYVKLRFHARD
ncbi:54S ribosomal protein L22, mitochondrial [Lathyrus oleraceus]|uniref:54S ribosomal protein L22, mitochondrial n=1 Tax=Pisum sativum TaxID=3888 RepID=UPI0021D16DF4|nr:54S ribosomal protein L22, mitochondrial-like [Pisum sativum]